jgi:hypothetical protein
MCVNIFGEAIDTGSENRYNQIRNENDSHFVCAHNMLYPCRFLTEVKAPCVFTKIRAKKCADLTEIQKEKNTERVKK